MAEGAGSSDIRKMTIIPNRYKGVKYIHGLKTWVESMLEYCSYKNKSWLKRHPNPLISLRDTTPTLRFYMYPRKFNTLLVKQSSQRVREQIIKDWQKRLHKFM